MVTESKKISEEKSTEELDKNYEVIFFESPEEWRKWLEGNHNSTNGVWLKFYKKATGKKSLNYGSALDEALCFGWIDGQANKYDEESYIQKFTPRRKQSSWSKKNVEHIGRLLKEGKMNPAGLKEVEMAKADGRWEKAYDSPSNMAIPEDFILKLSKDKNALAFFESLNKTNKYSIAWRLQTAKKPETREKRMNAIIEMLSRKEKLY